MDWRDQPNYPRPDFLSSSRKRLAPQLMFKGAIFHAWGKKMAVAMDEPFFNTLPEMEAVPQADADMAWLVYRLEMAPDNGGYTLRHHKTLHTKFDAALRGITRPKVGRIDAFLGTLQAKVDEKLEVEPVNRCMDSPLGGN